MKLERLISVCTMLIVLTVCVLAIVGCGEVVRTWDAGPDTHMPSPDGAVTPVSPDMYQTDTGKADTRPDAGPHKCSPAGYYTMYVRVISNTCPESILDKNSWWSPPSFHNSYWCGTYFWDDGGALEGNRIALCWNYLEATMDGLESWADCTIYESDWKIVCEFSIRTPLTKPQ